MFPAQGSKPPNFFIKEVTLRKIKFRMGIDTSGDQSRELYVGGRSLGVSYLVSLSIFLCFLPYFSLFSLFHDPKFVLFFDKRRHERTQSFVVVLISLLRNFLILFVGQKVQSPIFCVNFVWPLISNSYNSYF